MSVPVHIIDSDRYWESGVEAFFFPGGEPHVKINSDYNNQDVVLFLKARTWNDVGIGACVSNALALGPARTVSTFIPYFPGARQDRESERTPMTLALMANLFRPVNTTVPNRIYTFDEHSPFAQLYLGKHPVFMPKDLNIPTSENVVGIVAPDAGATARATSFRDAFYPGIQVIQCSKKRDPQSGRLSNYELPPLPPVFGRSRYIVVDDICDGGGTFNLLASAFDADPNGRDAQLTLFVSHGIFSKGLNAISSRYDKIITTDSWCIPVAGDIDDRLMIIPLSPLCDKIIKEMEDA
jgi:ribose-phosphate pyrophosphokinase